MDQYRHQPMRGVLMGSGRYRSVARPDFNLATTLMEQVPREFPFIYSEEFQDPENRIVSYQDLMREMRHVQTIWDDASVSTRNYLYNVAITTLNKASNYWRERQPNEINRNLGGPRQRIVAPSGPQSGPMSEDKENQEPLTVASNVQYL